MIHRRSFVSGFGRSIAAHYPSDQIDSISGTNPQGDYIMRDKFGKQSGVQPPDESRGGIIKPANRHNSSKHSISNC